MDGTAPIACEAGTGGRRGNQRRQLRSTGGLWCETTRALAAVFRVLLLARNLLVGGHADVLRRRRDLRLTVDRIVGDVRRGLRVAGALVSRRADVLLDASVVATAPVWGLLSLAHGSPLESHGPT